MKLVYRAFKICSPNYLQHELNHIRITLQENNYPIEFINKIQNHIQQQT